MPNIEIYGTEGSISVPDPNTFGGPVLLSTRSERKFKEMPLISPYFENSRGMGISDMALAISEGRINTASGKLALHVLEIMEAFTVSSEKNLPIEIESCPSDEIPLNWESELGELKTK